MSLTCSVCIQVALTLSTELDGESDITTIDSSSSPSPSSSDSSPLILTPSEWHYVLRCLLTEWRRVQAVAEKHMASAALERQILEREWESANTSLHSLYRALDHGGLSPKAGQYIRTSLQPGLTTHGALRPVLAEIPCGGTMTMV